MTTVFETFKPKNPVIAKYVDYYYIDSKPDNIKTEFTCFPHYNNVISLYRAHTRMPDGTMVFDKTVKPLQMFTPIRENVMQVRQLGELHRIVIVFNPLGVEQFYRCNFSGYITDYDFFTASEMQSLFETEDTTVLTDLLDKYLTERHIPFENTILTRSISYIFKHYEDFSIEAMAQELQTSRRHLVRVFKAHFGVSLKKFQQIVLFRKVMEHKLFANNNKSFTALAHEYNFSDQAHLNKVFEKLTQHSPKQFFNKGTLLGEQDTFWHFEK
ncbi:helix-turn-helix domain-containing protein [Flavobacterium cerinum]|uniref:AraC family transcriptional regulator n=1 Tax=Flavobacterium cerinum TaxID=2502784 RepID=A0ABY5IQR0_9FLAO|nr:AraC family transcriptional regulator [Flavobacterium cerinum]UUC45177.1 AraC family transcriptional regulator [Flavobacterium cerinum]